MVENYGSLNPKSHPRKKVYAGGSLWESTEDARAAAVLGPELKLSLV